VEAPVFGPEQVLVRHLDVGEAELASVGGVPAHLLELSGYLVAGHLSLQDEEGEAVVASLGARLHRTGQEVCANPVGDERLRTVDDVAAGHLAGGGPDPRDVGARVRLRDPERADPFAADAGDDPALALLFGAEVEHRRHRDRGVGVEAGGDATRATRAGQLLDPDGIVDGGAALAAVILRELEAEEPELAAASEQLPRELSRLLPLVDVRSDLVADKAPDCLAELLVLLGERRQQRPFAAVLDDGSAHSGLPAGGFHSSSVV
jgi:hypothetical protein